MIRKIVAATDLSDRGDKALHRAFALARARDARLIVLAVVDDALPFRLVRDIMADAKTSLAALAETHGAGVTVEIRVENGDPTGGVVACVEQEDPDLLVMGSHRERAFFDLLRETTAQRIARLTRVPVLIAANSDDRPHDTVILGADFSPNSTAGAALATELAPGARILPVHALHVPYRGLLAHTSAQEELLRSFSREPLRNDAVWRAEADLPGTLDKTEVIEGGAARVLGDVARREGAQLIVVGAHGRVGQHRAFLGSVASALMRDPPCDVLIVRKPAD